MKKYSMAMNGVKQYANDVEELREILYEVPQGATYDLNYTTGDRPWESGYFTITFDWSDE